MTPTRVVNIQSHSYIVFCGRGKDPLTGYQTPFDWGNPFSCIPGSTAKYRVKSKLEAVRRHEAWVREQPELMEKIKRELQGKVLGCYCPINDIKYGMCHAATLARIADEE